MVTRRSFTKRFKLKVLKRIGTKNDNGEAISKRFLENEYGLGAGTISKWEKKFKLDEKTDLNLNNKRIGKNLGCNVLNEELDRKLLFWVRDKIEKGLHFKHKYLKITALRIANEIGMIGFKASAGYLSNFKNRFNLVYRAKTNSTKLPENASILAKDFITDLNSTIQNYEILPENILNLDQVPRYFEQSSNKTLAFVGTKKVELMKAVNNHKRFTFTPLISAAGIVEKIHVLFSNLKRVPKNLDSQCIVEVNKSGMWNRDIFENYKTKHILTKVQTKYKNLKTLRIVDSFSGHLGIGDKYLNQNLIIKYIPPRMTSILQVLDVYCNRGFQQFYGSKYDEWLDANINNSNLFTTRGNLRTVPYATIVDWCLLYKEQVNSDLIKNGFKGCGISFETFCVDQCHSHLRNLIEEEDYPEKLRLDQVFYSDTNTFNISEWDLTSEKPLFEVVSELLNICNREVKNSVCDGLIEYLYLVEIIDEEYVNGIKNEDEEPYLNECYVASKKYEIQIFVSEIGKSTVVFGKMYKNKLEILFYEGKCYLKIMAKIFFKVFHWILIIFILYKGSFSLIGFISRGSEIFPASGIPG